MIHLVFPTLGRLSAEKGQDIIPEVAKLLKDDGIKFKWFLIGDGNLRTRIENDIEQYNLQNYIFLLGTKINPYPYLKESDIFVQTSVYEGECISLQEAKILCLPIVATNFTGTNEQLEAGNLGIVTERNVKRLYSQIKKLALDEQLIESYGRKLSLCN